MGKSRGMVYAWFTRCIVLCAVLLTHLPAWGMHPLVGEDTGTQGPGGVLAEGSINYLKYNEFKSTAIPVALTVGIGETMDAAVEVPYLRLQPSPVTGANESGLSDVGFKFKHRFYEKERKESAKEQFEQSFAYQLLYSKPTGDENKGLGAGTARWGVRLVSTTEWEPLEVNVNLGYDSSGKALRRGNFTFDHALLMSASAKYERTKPWEPVIELAVVRVKETDATARILNMLVGLIYEPSDKYYIDAGIRLGLNDQAEDHGLLAGFGYKF